MNREWSDGAGVVTIREMNGQELTEFVSARLSSMAEDETIAVLSNRFCTARICSRIANNARLSAYHEIKSRLVGCRAVPQHVAQRFVRHLYWSDLLRLSRDVFINPSVRRAIDQQLINGLTKLSLGEKVATAKICSREVSKLLMKDPDRGVFAALLENARAREEDLVAFIKGFKGPAESLTLVADHRKWGTRYAVRRALAFSPIAPKAVRASQVRFLTRVDRAELRSHPEASVYLRFCIDRFEEDVQSGTRH